MLPSLPQKCRYTRVVLVAAACAALPGSAHATQPGETPYSVALHMHGSMSEGLGSMEWHADRAQQTGVTDVIWWTDHDWRVEHWRHTNRYDFENATVDPATLRVSEPDDAYQFEFRYWDVTDTTSASWEVSVIDSVVFEGNQALRLSATTAGMGLFEGIHMAQTASRKQNRWSLAMRPVLHFSIFPDVLNTFTKFVVDVTLSEHPGQAHTLRYVAGSLSGESSNTIALSVQNRQWNTFDLDIVADAMAQFTSGGADTLRAEDNNLFDVRIGVETRRSQSVPVVFFDDYRIDADTTLGVTDMMSKTRTFASTYEGMYAPTSEFVGTEVSRFRAQPHLNGYAPNVTVVDYTGKGFADSIYYAVDQIHAQGGAMSLNHVFGTDVLGDSTETPQHIQSRIDSGKRAMLASRVYNCDMLEVGYRVRQGIDLAGFLDTWDAVTGNAIFVTGIGVTDSHGTDFLDGWGPWQPGNEFFSNNFVTWLYAKQFDEAGLIEPMKSGRAYFGDPFVFDPDGTVDLWTTDGFPMGRVVFTDRASHDVVVEIDGMPSSATVRLLQGEIRENPPVEYLVANYLRDEILSGTWNGSVYSDTVTIDTTLPSFVRVEVDDQGTATAFSNPIHFVTSVPALGIQGPRVAAAVGDVKILGAAEFTLMGATLTSGNLTSFVVTGDEETPGLGSLEIDTGVLGQPQQVLGGGFTSSRFQNGVLTLVGFTGVGSTVELQWGATDVDVTGGRIDRLTLEVGHPNPFGEGTVAKFALPHPASVFLEVLDVRGRRIRLLIDERRDRGVHSVAWDGRDSLGRSVAAGVYFFRVGALGEVLTAKAVRIR